ncbi:MAG: ATP-binding protein, partial [Promethearchaeota archaeon]
QYYIQAILRDITERKLAEQKLIESENNYRKAYDRADFYKDLFAYDMNYILRNINSSSDFLSLIFKNPKIQGDKDELIQSIKEQALRGLNLILYIQKILDIDDTDLSMERLEINIVLNEAITFVTNNFHERLLKIKIETPGAGLWVKTNELLLEVFESILINAAEHNDKPFVSMKIRISKEKKEDIIYFKLEFLDNGMGIPDNMKEKIFLKGYREDESISGMGLGLYLVKRIVDSFKGKIWVQDRIKGDHTKGCNVILLIPEA